MQATKKDFNILVTHCTFNVNCLGQAPEQVTPLLTTTKTTTLDIGHIMYSCNDIFWNCGKFSSNCLQGAFKLFNKVGVR